MIETLARLLLLYAVLRAVYELGQEDARRDIRLHAYHKPSYLLGFTAGMAAGVEHAREHSDG